MRFAFCIIGMFSISEIKQKYLGKLECLDLDLIIAHAIKKSREFVLTHSEYKLVKSQNSKVKSYLSRRIKSEPLAYILGEKEFFGLKFKVNKNTLIPRPETEMIVEKIIINLQSINKNKKTIIVDIGTGSGNIIISIANEFKKNTKYKIPDTKYYGTDISKKALIISKQNAKLNKVDEKIKFLHGNLLSPVIENCKFKIENSTMIIVANLPYLSRKIYKSSPKDVKNYEPKSALISEKEGLAHYENLLEQIKVLNTKYKIQNTIFMEISPEQKNKIAKLIKKYFSKSKIIFHKDLSGRWRICEAEFRI